MFVILLKSVLRSVSFIMARLEQRIVSDTSHKSDCRAEILKLLDVDRSVIRVYFDTDNRVQQIPKIPASSSSCAISDRKSVV